jgi:hypothetical protein
MVIVTQKNWYINLSGEKQEDMCSEIAEKNLNESDKGKDNQINI